jgi:hypothetical protein
VDARKSKRLHVRGRERERTPRPSMTEPVVIVMETTIRM